MTANKDLKKLIRARMAATGQNYTAVRAALESEYAADERFYAKTCRTFFDASGALVSIPTKRRARVVVLVELLSLFDSRKTYPETEVNRILSRVHEDVALLRRELVDYGFMGRQDGIYRMAQSPAETDQRVDQELTPVSLSRLRAVQRS